MMNRKGKFSFFIIIVNCSQSRHEKNIQLMMMQPVLVNNLMEASSRQEKFCHVASPRRDGFFNNGGQRRLFRPAHAQPILDLCDPHHVLFQPLPSLRQNPRLSAGGPLDGGPRHHQKHAHVRRRHYRADPPHGEEHVHISLVKLLVGRQRSKSPADVHGPRVHDEMVGDFKHELGGVGAVGKLPHVAGGEDHLRALASGSQGARCVVAHRRQLFEKMPPRGYEACFK